MCGLEDRQLRNRMVEYEDRNKLSAFFLPMLVNLNLLLIVWGAAMLPEGISGLLDRLYEGDDIRIGIALMFPKVAHDATPITWVLFGAYFYTASVMIRRWMQSDLTTNVIWSINVRLVVAFILGLLLMEIVSEEGTAANELGPYVSCVAFMVGIVPDAFLRWVSRQARRVASVDVEYTRLFAPSELQQKIDGMSYWQADRLAEEGVESVQDLAMKEIPSLLIKTRFDTALLLTWVDRALLCNQAGADVELFKRAHIHTASEFIALARQPEGQTTVLRSLADAQTLLSDEGEIPAPTAGRPTPGDPATAMPITPTLLANIASGLENGPNLRHLTSYWANVNGRPAPETHATTVDHPGEPGAGSTGASG
jgi:hypothetical protein